MFREGIDIYILCKNWFWFIIFSEADLFFLGAIM